MMDKSAIPSLGLAWEYYLVCYYVVMKLVMVINISHHHGFNQDIALFSINIASTSTFTQSGKYRLIGKTVCSSNLEHMENPIGQLEIFLSKAVYIYNLYTMHLTVRKIPCLQDVQSLDIIRNCGISFVCEQDIRCAIARYPL